MKRKEVYLLLFIVGLDQLTKYWAKNVLKGSVIEVIPSFLRFFYVENDGAAWSILSGRMIFFYIISIAYLIFFTTYLFKHRHAHSFLRYCFVIVMAGTIGNFIDRLHLKFVIDFISVNIFGYQFPIFNIADMAIVIGAFGLIYYTIFLENKGGNKNDELSS